MSVSIEELSSPHAQVARRSLDLADDEAFERLHADYGPYVERVVRRYLWGAVVDDTVQETFVQAYRSQLHRRRGDGERRTVKRLAAIARNRSVDVLRKRMRGLEEITDDGRLATLAASTAEADPELHLQAARRREGIADAVDTLCDRQRRVLLLRHVAGHPYDEIARIEGISVDAVKASLARGRRAFRLAYAAIAERRGLSVIPGFGLLRRLHARLRWAGHRVVTGTQEAVATFATVSPAITQGVVVAVVVGSVAVAGAGFGPSTATTEPVAHTSEAPEQRSGEADAPQEGEHGEEGAPKGDAGEPSSQEERAASESETQEPVGNESRKKPPVQHEASAEADSDEVAGTEAPANAQAKGNSKAKADAEEADASSDQEGAVETTASLTETDYETTSHVGVGCESGEDDAVKDALCPALTGQEDPTAL